MKRTPEYKEQFLIMCDIPIQGGEDLFLFEEGKVRLNCPYELEAPTLKELVDKIFDDERNYKIVENYLTRLYPRMEE